MKLPNMTELFDKKLGVWMLGFVNWCERVKGRDWLFNGGSHVYINDFVFDRADELVRRMEISRDIARGALYVCTYIDYERKEKSQTTESGAEVLGYSLRILKESMAHGHKYGRDVLPEGLDDYEFKMNVSELSRVCKGIFTQERAGMYVSVAVADHAIGFWIWSNKRKVTDTKFALYVIEGESRGEIIDFEVDHALESLGNKELSQVARRVLANWLYYERYGVQEKHRPSFEEMNRRRERGDFAEVWLKMQSRLWVLPESLKLFREGSEDRRGTWSVRRYGKGKILIDPVLPVRKSG